MTSRGAFDSVRASLVQFPVSDNIEQNRSVISAAIADSEPEALLVLPEGALSGYRPEAEFLAGLDPTEIRRHMLQLRAEATEAQVHLCFGSLLFYDGEWVSAGIYFGPKGQIARYEKTNLATLERGLIKSGSVLTPFDTEIAGQPVRMAFQLCRELRHPEQWQHLARRKTQVFLHLNNAVGDASIAPVWRSHLISRAAENQRYVLSVNNAGDDQKCPTTALDPTGVVLAEATGARVQRLVVDLDLPACGDRWLSEARLDLIASGQAG